MSVLRKTAAGAVFGGSLLVVAGMGLASAQPEEEAPPAADGMVNLLTGGNVLLDNATVEAAAAQAAGICGQDPAAVTALVQQVDAEGAEQTVCTDVLIVQNTPPAPEEPPALEAPSEPPPIPGEEAPAEEPEGSPAPAVPGEGEADEPFNTEG